MNESKQYYYKYNPKESESYDKDSYDNVNKSDLWSNDYFSLLERIISAEKEKRNIKEMYDNLPI